MSLVACAVCRQPFYASCHDGACLDAACPRCELAEVHGDSALVAGDDPSAAPTVSIAALAELRRVTGANAARCLQHAETTGANPTERSTIVTTSDRRATSIFEAAGGQEAFSRLAAEHHRRCLDDPVLSHPFSHPGHPRHVERLAAYWAEVFGGPPAYTHLAGGHSAMLALHARTQADDDLGARFVRCFVAALDDAGLPDDDELHAALRAYMEWAVRDVLRYAPADAAVPRGHPVPRWTWDGLQTGPDR